MKYLVSLSKYIFGIGLFFVTNIALAQDAPTVITPLQLKPDHNGVNLVTGKIKVELPKLAVPAAPRLSYERIQDVAPYISGKAQYAPIGTPRNESYSAHIGAESSLSFNCYDSNCVSATGDGSKLTVSGAGRVLTQSGSGTKITYNVMHVRTVFPGTNIAETTLYYASRADYTDGETIIYTYQNGTLSGDTFSRTFRRPTRVESNRGYYLTFTYQGNVVGTNEWNTVAQAEIYSTDAPAAPIGRLVYGANGATITDIGGRVFQCGGCAGGLGNKIEVAAGELKLPGESTPQMQAISHPSLNLVSSVNQDGAIWNYNYLNPVFETSVGDYRYTNATVTGPDGYSAVYSMNVHEKRNRIASVTDGLGRTTQYGYDGFRLTQITQPEGDKVQIAYDDFFNIVQKTTIAKPGSGLPNAVETANYNVTGCSNVLCYRPTWHRDALGRQTDFVHNTSGQLTEKTDPPDATGVRRRTIIEYVNGRKTVERICGVGSTCGTSGEYRTEFEYWRNTLLPAVVRQIDTSLGAVRTTSYSYDNAGRVLSVDPPGPGTDDASYNRYDIFGRKTWEIGPKNNNVRPAKRIYYRDADDKVVAIESGHIPDQNSTVLTVLSRIDTVFGPQRLAIRDISSSGGAPFQVADKSYNGQGAVICQTVRLNLSNIPAAGAACTKGPNNADGDEDRITRNVYDIAGQLLKIEKAVGTSLQQDYVTYTYSANGKMVSVKDANGNLATMNYDGFDRQTRWNFPSKSTVGTVSTTDYEQYGYDPVGNRTSFRKRDGSVITYQYDSLNRIIAKIVPERAGLAATHTRDVYYGYDLRGLQLYARFDNNTGEGVASTYDGFGQMVSNWYVMDGTSRTLNYAFDQNGNRTNLTHSDGYNFVYTYDGLNRPIGIYAHLNGIHIQYGYYNSGQLNFISRLGGSNSIYYYDNAQRLQTMTNGFSNGNYNLVESFGYNAASQIASRTTSNDAYVWTGAVNANRTYAANGLNQYSSAGARCFEYDDNGNLTADKACATPNDATRTNYVYDVENRLVLASGATNASLRYDVLGRLYETGPSLQANSATRRYLYDGDELIAEFDLNGVMQHRYVHGRNTDDPVLWYEGSTLSNPRYLHTNWQGSIVAVTDATNNQALAINRYDEYGIPAAGNVGRFQYTGQAWLPELGMYYYKARIYSPTLGRFLQTDPIGYKDQMNLYAYVGNDPVNGRDPSGMETCVDENGEKIICVTGKKEQGKKDRCSGRECIWQAAWNRTVPKPQNGQCSSSSSDGHLDSARAFLETTATGADVATVGFTAAGITAPVAVATKLVGYGAEAGLLGINLYDGFANGSWGGLQVQAAGAATRLIPGGRALQSGLRTARGPTGILRNSAGQFRSSHINNPAVAEAGDLTIQNGAQAAAGALACR